MTVTPVSAAGAAAPTYKAGRWYALAILTLVYTSSYVDRTIFSVVQEAIKKELQLTDTQLGFMGGTAFGLFYATLGIPIALLADRSNRRNIIAVATAVWSAMTALCGLSTNFWQMVGARIGVGVGEAGSSPPSHSMIADMFAPAERSRAMAIFALGVYLGAMLAFLIGSYVVTIYGWRWTFFIVGLPGILIALLVWLTVKEPQRGHSEGAIHAPPARTLKEAIASLVGAFRFLWQSRACRHIIIGVTLTSFVGYGGVQFATSFLMRTHQMTYIQVGLFLAPVAGFVGVAGALLGGYLADRYGKGDIRWTAWVVGFAKFGAVPFGIAFYLIDDVTIALAIYLPAAFLGAFYLGPSFALIQSLSPIAMRATAAATMLFVINIIGLGLGPLIVGKVSDMLIPTFGTDSLRYALLFTYLINIWAAAHYMLAGNALGRDAKKAAA